MADQKDINASVTVPAPSSPSPNLDHQAKKDWKGGVNHGSTDPSSVLDGNRYNNQPVK